MALTVAEVRRLLRRLLMAHRPSREEVLHWSSWRRHHQAIAKRCHYKKRGGVLA